MASDFTIVQMVRQRFGDLRAALEEELPEQESPFVGASKSFPFSCPNIVPGAPGVLQFESLSVTTGIRSPRNILRINDVDIPGGITPGEGLRWKAHSLIVPPNVLRPENVLYIESIVYPFGSTIDDFIIDNIVVFFKTRTGRTVGVEPGR